MAAPEDVVSRDLEFSVQFHTNAACSAGGPIRNYDAGSCLPLGDQPRGLELLRRNSDCYGTKQCVPGDEAINAKQTVTSYTGGSCNGSGRKLDANGCWNLSGRQSIKFNCD